MLNGHELIRAALRRALGARSGLYGAGAGVVDSLSILSREGFGVWRTLRAAEKATSGQSPISLSLRGLQSPILIRPGTADVRTIIDNVVRQEYGQLDPITPEPRWMIDAGAYIGDTTAYFLSRFPSLRVIALEPTPESCALAKHNLRDYGDRAEILNKGLHSKAGVYQFAGGGTGAAMTEHGGTCDVSDIECVTVAELLDAYGIEQLDILKLDIEGAEEAVFEGDATWLARVRLILMEVHGGRLEQLLRPILKSQGFVIRTHRSVWYCERTR